MEHPCPMLRISMMGLMRLSYTFIMRSVSPEVPYLQKSRLARGTMAATAVVYSSQPWVSLFYDYVSS